MRQRYQNIALNYTKYHDTKLHELYIAVYILSEKYLAGNDDVVSQLMCIKWY